MAERRPTHILSSYFAPRGHNRMYALGMQIAHSEDTNLYHRGGLDGARWAAAAAKKLLKEHIPYPGKTQIAELDDAFIERNLSPGGCADLLAATYFLHSLHM